MTADELLDQLHRAGATIEIVDGKPRLRGARVCDELIAALKSNRDAVLAELEARKAADRDRYQRVPTHPVSMHARDLQLVKDMRFVVENYCIRQGRPVQAWVAHRAQEYFELGVSADDCDWRACIDLICWQRDCGTRDAIQFVSGLNECADNLPKGKK